MSAIHGNEYIYIDGRVTNLYVYRPLCISDEDINTSATIIPSVEILSPITRSRAQ
jgi:hypothetical protein